jgi:hypothetical protein
LWEELLYDDAGQAAAVKQVMNNSGHVLILSQF